MKKSITPLLLVLCPLIIYIPVIAWALNLLGPFYIVILIYVFPFIIGYIIFLLVKKRPLCTILFIFLTVFFTLGAPFLIFQSDKTIAISHIEKIAPALIEQYEPDTRVKLPENYAKASADGYAYITDDSVWFPYAYSHSTATIDTYLVYSNGNIKKEDIYYTEAPKYNKTIGD